MSNLSKRDRIIPWYFVAFFLFIAAVNAVMVTLAIRTHSGLVTDHPYEKGLAYNQTIKAEEEQTQLGWKADISLMENILKVALKDSEGKAFIPDKITAKFTRPTQSGVDFEVELNGGAATINFPEQGLWNVRIFATKGDKTYQQAKRLVVQ